MFNQYQKESAGVFKPTKPLQNDQIRLLDWALGLGGETGEVLDLLKHSIFHEEAQIDKMELAKELGDVMWYVAAIATTCEIDLADIAELNRAKLKHRYGQAYSAEASAARHKNEVQFKDTTIYQCLTARINNTANAPVNVIVIGPDGSGKTTLTTLLAEKLGMDRIKCDYRQENKPTLAKQLLQEKINVIYDRFYFPDELVYSGAKNIKLDKAYVDELLSIWEVLKLVNPVFIYVNANTETLTKRSEVWADDYITVNDLIHIKAHYAEVLQLLEEEEVPVIRVDTSDVELNTEAYDKFIESLVKQILQCKKDYGLSQVLKEDIV